MSSTEFAVREKEASLTRAAVCARTCAFIPAQQARAPEARNPVPILCTGQAFSEPVSRSACCGAGAGFHRGRRRRPGRGVGFMSAARVSTLFLLLRVRLTKLPVQLMMKS